MIMFWILAIVFGMISLTGLRVYFFGSGWSTTEVISYSFTIIVTAFSISVIYAGSWSAAMAFFGG